MQSHLSISIVTQVRTCTVKSVSNGDKSFILKPSYVCLGVLPNFLMASCLPRTLLFLQDISTVSCENTPCQPSQVAADFCVSSPFQSTVSSGPGCGVGVLFVPTARFQAVLLESSFPFEDPFLSPTSLVIHQCLPQDFSLTVLSSLQHLLQSGDFFTGCLWSLWVLVLLTESPPMTSA